jgi:hypothetical protein
LSTEDIRISLPRRLRLLLEEDCVSAVYSPSTMLASGSVASTAGASVSVWGMGADSSAAGAEPSSATAALGSSPSQDKSVDFLHSCRGQPRGSPKTTKGILLKTYKKPKLNTSHLSTHTDHGPHCGVPTAHQSGPLKGPLERVPPRSRVHTSLEQVPPRSRVHGSLERAPPRSRVHLRLARGFCTRTSVPARGYGNLML